MHMHIKLSFYEMTLLRMGIYKKAFQYNGQTKLLMSDFIQNRYKKLKNKVN